MAFRGLQLRAVLVPLAVAAFLVGALSWYGAYYIPQQAQYLNERNSRLLSTIGLEVQSKVDNFDLAVDHAVESFEQADLAGEPFKRYVKLFATDLEIETA